MKQVRKLEARLREEDQCEEREWRAQRSHARAKASIDCARKGDRGEKEMEADDGDERIFDAAPWRRNSDEADEERPKESTHRIRGENTSGMATCVCIIELAFDTKEKRNRCSEREGQRKKEDERGEKNHPRLMWNDRGLTVNQNEEARDLRRKINRDGGE